MEFITGFLVGLGWWIIVPAVLLSYWTEHKERSGWSLFFLLISFMTFVAVFDLSNMTVLYALLAYIPIGLIWSIFRWKRFCSKKTEEYKSKFDKKHSVPKRRSSTWSEYETPPRDIDVDAERRYRECLTRDLALELDFTKNTNLENIILWILVWPISVIDSLIGDLIDGLESIVRAISKSTYKKFTDASVSDLDEYIKSSNQDEKTDN